MTVPSWKHPSVGGPSLLFDHIWDDVGARAVNQRLRKAGGGVGHPVGDCRTYEDLLFGGELGVGQTFRLRVPGVDLRSHDQIGDPSRQSGGGELIVVQRLEQTEHVVRVVGHRLDGGAIDLENDGCTPWKYGETLHGSSVDGSP